MFWFDIFRYLRTVVYFVTLFVVLWLIVIYKIYLSSLKNNIRTLVLEERECRLKAYVHVQGEGITSFNIPWFEFFCAARIVSKVCGGENFRLSGRLVISESAIPEKQSAGNFLICSNDDTKMVTVVISEGGFTRRGKNWDHVFLLAIPLLLMKQLGK